MPVRILTVADRHVSYGKELSDQLKKKGFLCEIDDSSESINKKVRNAQLDKVNYILTVGDIEVKNKTISLRTRDNVVHGEMALDSFLKKITLEKEKRELMSPFSGHKEKG